MKKNAVGVEWQQKKSNRRITATRSAPRSLRSEDFASRLS